MSKRTVYVASPTGFTELGRRHYEEDILHPLRALGFDVLDPWKDVLGESSSDLSRNAKSLPAHDSIKIGDRNAVWIRRADVVLAILDGPDVDSGVAAEVGYAAALGKKVVGYRGDFRLSGDFVSLPTNAQLVAFIQSSGGRVYGALSEALGALNDLK